MKPPKIAVCIPAHDQVATMFAYDLASLVQHTARGPLSSGALEGMALAFVTGTYVHRARQDLAEYALEIGADYVLWLDSDMRFPRDALIRLLMHDRAIVGINYSARTVPPDFTAIKRVADGEDDGERCVTGPDSTGLERVDAIGGGVMLVRTDVYRAIAEKPWYWYDYRDDTHYGEDVYFCLKAKEAGFQPFVDHDLSRACAHIGSIEYTTDHALHFAGQGSECPAP